MNVIAKISCYFSAVDKILNSLVYRTLFYVNIYGSYKLLKTVRFWPTLYVRFKVTSSVAWGTTDVQMMMTIKVII